MRTHLIAIVSLPLLLVGNVAVAQQTCDDIGGSCFEGCPEGWVDAPSHPDSPVAHPPEWYGDDWGCFDSACCVPAEDSPPTTAPSELPSDLDFDLTVDGEPVWPPTGPGCDALVACCDAMAHDDTVQLACQLAMATDPDCPTALTTVRHIIVELGVDTPPACAP